jgi:hypothetical protein
MAVVGLPSSQLQGKKKARKKMKINISDLRGSRRTHETLSGAKIAPKKQNRGSEVGSPNEEI